MKTRALENRRPMKRTVAFFGLRLFFIFQVLAILSGGGSGRAQWSDDAQKCSSSKDPDAAIQYCTKAIQSSQLSDEDLAVVLYTRGNAYLNKMDYDRAIQDHDQAIRLDPNY